ncbi:MAG: hypothetical protein JOY82_16435 [Streptosporangiaceae bacterium]|nr:hypothetical protein [Streptosporangiaceae bacterium]MBV9856080.1 hypothetical protein [Streptosporangiaceae bacterium]
MTWRDPGDDLASDIIGSGGGHCGLPARWPWLSRLIRRAGSTRLRWAAGAVLAAAAAAAVLALPAAHPGAGSPHPARVSAAGRHDGPAVVISSVMAGTVAPGGVFAEGAADGHPWQLAVRDIAAPGFGCQPGVTVNGNDADPLFARPAMRTPVGSLAFMTPGPAMPGVGFAIIGVRADVSWVWLDPAPINGLMLGLPPVTITSCGQQFRLAGFAYPLAGTLRIDASTATGSLRYAVPRALSAPQPSLAAPQVDGVWQDMDTAHAQVAAATLATGRAFGQRWSIQLGFGTAGDCFTLRTAYIDDSANARPEQTSFCGPVSTPHGPDTIMALALGSPAGNGQGVGYAVSVGPGTAHLTAQLSTGATFPVTPVVAAGRRYAAFFVPGPAHLARLNWDNAAGQEIAGIRGLPDYGYTQFQP